MQVQPLDSVADLSIAGGKARSLAQLLGAGFLVPPGFVVTDSSGDDTAALGAYDALGARFVAVRSSAVNEDGGDAAWAGQLETFLNVTRDNLVDRIHACAMSAESARAQAYAAEKGISSGGVAVVVQAMVDSDVSGVAFSAHPVTGSKDHLVIEAGMGLGEAIVSGDITPDTYVLEAASGKVSESYIGAQTKRLRRGPDGGNEWQPIDPANTAPKLSAKQLSELADTVRKLAGFYDFPVDVEWAYEGGKLYILQARPITTL